MACDIHIYVERNYHGKWVYFGSPHVQERNYRRFAALAGVRDDKGPDPKGLPKDLSDSVHMHYDFLAGDAHSMTWYDLETACLIFAATEYDDKYSDALNQPHKHLDRWAWEYFGVWHYESLSDYRVVMWFDN